MGDDYEAAQQILLAELALRGAKQEAVLRQLRAGFPSPPDAFPASEAVAETDRYLERARLDQGTLVLFDQRHDAPPPRTRTRLATVEAPSGRDVTLLRL